MAATSKSKEAYYASYKNTNRWRTNREKRLMKALLNNPNNKQIETAMNNLRYRRGNAGGVVGSWSKTNIRLAKLFKMFTGHASHDLFSSNPKVQGEALSRPMRWAKPDMSGKVSFSLGARAHDNRGRAVWG